jgi:hypothetical protein
MNASPDGSNRNADSAKSRKSAAPSGEVQPAGTVPTPAPPTPDYDERGVPSLDYVRDKIEARYTTALGASELAEGTAEARSIEEQQEERAKAAKEKLEEIRRNLGR